MKTYPISIICLFTVFMTNLTACGGSSSSSSAGGGSGSNTGPSNAYYKLVQGDTWTYVNTNVYNPGTNNSLTTTNTIANTVGATTSGNTIINSVITPPTGTPSTNTYTMSFDANNNLLMSNTQTMNTFFVSGLVKNVKFLPAIPAVKDTWKILNLTYTVTALDGTITTAAGTFTGCLVVTAIGTDNYTGYTINTINYFSAVAGNLVHVSGTSTSPTSTSPSNITIDLKNYTLI